MPDKRFETCGSCKNPSRFEKANGDGSDLLNRMETMQEQSKDFLEMYEKFRAAGQEYTATAPASEVSKADQLMAATAEVTTSIVSLATFSALELEAVFDGANAIDCAAFAGEGELTFCPRMRYIAKSFQTIDKSFNESLQQLPTLPNID